jgi:hypothetical protein
MSTRRRHHRRQEKRRPSGREYEPPRRPDILTRFVVVAFNDRRYGDQKGRADAKGHGMADAQGIPHAERLIDAQADRAMEDQRHGFRYPVENAEKVRQDAIEEHSDAVREVGKLSTKDEDLAAEEAALGRRHGPGRVGYGLILAALFCLTLPIDYGAAMWTPLPPLGQWMVAIFIGVVTVLCAHQEAKKIEDLEETHATREENQFPYRKDQIAVVSAMVVPLAVIVGTTIWRGQVFASDAEATGGPIHSGAANLALGLLALLAFVVAVIAGMGFRRMQPLREIQLERKRLAKEHSAWQTVMDQAERRQRQAEVTLAFLEKREEHVVQAIGHWARERKARLRQRAAWVSMRQLGKDAKTNPPTAVLRMEDESGHRESPDRSGEQLHLIPLTTNGRGHGNDAG